MTVRNGKRATCAAILAVAIFVVSTTVPMFFDDVSAETVSIGLVDASGNELGASPIFNTDLCYDTDVSAQGTVFILSGGSPINTMEDVSLKITAPSGTFGLDVIIHPSEEANSTYGTLATTGIRMNLTNGNDAYHADLTASETAENNFKSVLKDAEENTAILQPGVNYHVSLCTIDTYQSTVAPTAASGLTVDFGLFIGGSGHLVKFVSDGLTVEERILYDNDVIGQLPSVSNDGYDFNGWFDSQNRPVTSSTPVSTLTDYTITASWSEQVDDDEEETWPKVTVVEDVIQNEDGSTTYRTTTTTVERNRTTTVDVVDRTIWPDGSTSEKESSETIDKKGNKSSSTTSTEVIKNEDGTETWKTDTEIINSDGSVEKNQSTIEYDAEGKQTGYTIDSNTKYADGTESSVKTETVITKNEDGTETWTVSEEERTDAKVVKTDSVSNYNASGDLESEYKDIEYQDSEGKSKNFSVAVTNTGDEGNTKYRVETTVPDLNDEELNQAKEIIESYTYDTAVINVQSDTGTAILTQDALPVMADNGYGVSISSNEHYVMLDKDVVSALSELGTSVALIVEKASADTMTDRQIATIGDKYAIIVELVSKDQKISNLGGKAEIGATPGYKSVTVYYVADNGTRVPVESTYDENTGKVTFIVEHFSVYVMDWEENDASQSVIIFYVGLCLFLSICVTYVRVKRGQS